MNYLFSNHLFMVRVTDFCGLFMILIYFFVSLIHIIR